MQFLIHIMAWSVEYRSFVVEEFIQNGGSPLRGDIGWPSRSPDVTPCYLKAQVYQHRPQTLEALKGAITQEVAAIPPEMTRKVMENYREMLNQCINNVGRHFNF
jgi:hypothetical protein